MYRCETCKTVTALTACMKGHGPTRALTADEADRYVRHGHEAFDDLRAVKDADGGIVRYATA